MDGQVHDLLGKHTIQCVGSSFGPCATHGRAGCHEGQDNFVGNQVLRYSKKFLFHFTKLTWTITLLVGSLVIYSLAQATWAMVIRAVREQNFDLGGTFNSLIGHHDHRNEWF